MQPLAGRRTSRPFSRDESKDYGSEAKTVATSKGANENGVGPASARLSRTVLRRLRGSNRLSLVIPARPNKLVASMTKLGGSGTSLFGAASVTKALDTTLM